MFYETAKNDHGLPYNPFKSCVVPRPIGWIFVGQWINSDRPRIESIEKRAVFSALMRD